LDNSHLTHLLDRAIAKLDFLFYSSEGTYKFEYAELKDLKEQLIDFIIASDNKLIYDGCGDEILNRVLYKGFKGYSNFTFEELVSDFFKRFESVTHLLEQLEIYFDNYYLPVDSKDEVTDIEVIQWVQTFNDRVYRL
jgi:hypothetical protein